MPEYSTENHPCDLLRACETARRNRSTQPNEKRPPHIFFANAESDEELIDFVRSFGPVVAKSCEVTFHQSPSETQIRMTAQQDLQELRTEQRIYKTALWLVMELARNDGQYDAENARKQIAEIARLIPAWPEQWEREKEARANDIMRGAREEPLWNIPAKSIQSIAELAQLKRDLFLPPQLDARIVICEILNAFPWLAFPNPVEMHSYLKFGIRPLLYTVLQREFLQPNDIGVCADTQCKAFFEVKRAGQRFCNAECSRQHRQRDYWKRKGKNRRQQRLAKAKSKSNHRANQPAAEKRALK